MSTLFPVSMMVQGANAISSLNTLEAVRVSNHERASGVLPHFQPGNREQLSNTIGVGLSDAAVKTLDVRELVTRFLIR
jgi:hypothetical protein